ncbi:hypothetical protein IWW36_003435 [Coemansia brasiliensis]|uniref:FAD dependent oxidoreductase domain-containing protein n=1 Tax=Coemansia brasiliensis TaxID=2650707 RepID=A0A9W8LYJ8_9FUNG|nr:hypothetical protein IWW36_003435 [Coemansia brasiliensis]
MQQAVVVVGAGVIGLSVACKLQETGKYSVAIVAENVPCANTPQSRLSTKWASPWAGAHWRAWASNQDTDLQEMEMRTYREMLRRADDAPESGISVAQGVELYEESPAEPLWYASMVENAREIPLADLPEGIEYGLEYTTLLINVPKYLLYLKSLFVSKGGRIYEQSIEHILDAVRYAPAAGPASALPIVVNCTGLGSRALGGVNDKKLYPIRGQTLLVNAAEAKRTVTRIGSQKFSYVIPRGDGTVVIGGSVDKHKWSCEPSNALSRQIISRALELEPALLPVQSSETLGSRLEMLAEQIVSVGVGLRPMREGGVRLEIEKMRKEGAGLVSVIHCYGHGGFGFQSSLAFADKALELANAL